MHKDRGFGRLPPAPILSGRVAERDPGAVDRRRTHGIDRSKVEPAGAAETTIGNAGHHRADGASPSAITIGLPTLYDGDLDGLSLHKGAYGKNLRVTLRFLTRIR